MYQYIGSQEILKQVKEGNVGKIISGKQDIIDWIRDTKQIFNHDNEVVATFVIDLHNNLRINDRRSEHVVCANGEAVLSAGEITFQKHASTGIIISQITNQSTGYCPSAESWAFVQPVLSLLGISHPNTFTTAFIFRVCKNCGNINVIKDDYYCCLNCEQDLERNA